MAKYEHLRIYKKSLDLTVYIEDIVKHFSKYHKYTVGSRLRDLTYSVTVLIVKINNRKKEERKEKMFELMETIEEIMINLNICRELKAFNSPKSFFHSVELVQDISRQSAGWYKHSFEAPES
jgi:DNA gyrase/topoisomerase IV subunit B